MNILEKYIDIAIESVKEWGSPYINQTIKILKTDVHNEAREDFPIVPKIWHLGTVCCVDNDILMIDEALHRFPIMAIRYGDIRRLPFPDDYFDVVLDFSTIDHIGEYEIVLDEYERVTKLYGIVNIVVWLNKVDRHISFPGDSGQYYFNEKEFSEYVGSRFGVLKKETYPWALGGDGTGILTRFLCRKND